jgi:hypothetical protein
MRRPSVPQSPHSPTPTFASHSANPSLVEFGFNADEIAGGVADFRNDKACPSGRQTEPKRLNLPASIWNRRSVHNAFI